MKSLRNLLKTPGGRRASASAVDRRRPQSGLEARIFTTFRAVLILLPLALLCGLAWPANLLAEAEDQGFVCGTPGVLPASPGGAAKPLADLGNGAPLTHGRVSVLVIFAKFAGEAQHVRSAPDYASALFDADLPGSFSHFYHTMSAGQLEIQGTVLTRRYESEEKAAAYLAGGPNEVGQFGRFIEEILQKVDRDVDFGLFDNDGPDGVPNSGDDDGEVDYIFVNVRSVPRFFLLNRATGIATLGLVEAFESQDVGRNGEPIRILGGSAKGAIQQEGTFSKTVGVMAHEFGHRWRLPDLYDRSYEGPVDDSAGIGQWGLMGWGAHGWTGNDGPAAFSAWTLEHLGWIGRDNERVVEVKEDVRGVLLEDLHAGGTVLKIPLLTRGNLNQFSTASREYLLLEQRTRSGSFYNRNIPGEGLLVWQVRAPSGGNNDERDKQVDLICADGLYQDAGYPAGRLADPESGLDNLDFWSHRAAYREDHMGNWGDSTDPFDGVRFTRLGLDSNPSSNPQGQISAASTGLELAMRALDKAMEVDVVLPRWAGTIDGQVHWAGDVLIDGDLHVAPEGILVIHEDTQVRFAGQDRLRSGLDPDHIELDIQGDFRIIKPREPAIDKVVFATQNPDETWYGILINPAASGGIRVPGDSYEIRGSQFGVVIPGAPEDAQGQVLSSFQISDDPGLETSGNGDGQLGPGESFTAHIELDNWSLTEYKEVQATLEWDNPLVRSVQNPSSATPRLILSTSFPFFPGARQRFASQLILSPEAQAGEQIRFFLNFRQRQGTRLAEIPGAETWQDTLSFTVVGNYPDHEVEFEVPDFESSASSITVPLDRQVPFRALIRGEIDGADLVVRSLPELEPVLELPMQARPDQGDQRVFEALFDPPAADLYRFFLRVRSPEGAVVFSESSQDVGAFLISEPSPLLVFLGDHYDNEEKKALTAMLEEIFAEMGQSAHFFNQAPASGLDYGPILERGLEQDGVVLWLGQNMGPEAQQVFGEFLQGGGRLLLVSETAAGSGSMRNFRTEYLHIRTTEPALGSQTLRSLYLDESIELNALHHALELRAAALPLLLNSQHKAAALRLDTGTYRAVFLPFDLHQLEEAVAPLIRAGMVFLRQQAVQEALLDIPDHELVGQALGLRADRPTPVRATVAGQVERAELVVRSFPELESLLDLPMTPVEQTDGTRVFEVDFEPPDQGQYQLFLRLFTPAGQKLIGSTSVRILAVFSARPVLVLLGDQYSRSDKETLRGQIDQALGELDLEATTIDLLDEDEAFYDALLNQYRDEGELVAWLGETMAPGPEAAFRRFLERGGRLLLISLEFTEEVDNRAFREEMLQVLRTHEVGTASLHSLYLSEPIEFDVQHHWLEFEAPAEPVLLNADHLPVGLRLDTGTYRTVYLPFDLRRLPVDVVVPLIQSGVKFLQQQLEAAVELELESAIQVGRARAVASDRRIRVRARVGSAVAADLIVRFIPQLGQVARVPMQRGEAQAGKEVFEVEFPAPAPGQYHLSVQLQKADGQRLFGDAGLRVLSLSPAREALVFFGEHYGPAEKQALRAQFSQALGPRAGEAAFVDLGFEEGAFYEVLLSQYLVEGGLAVWLGGTMDEKAQAAFADYLAAGGRLLLASSAFAQSTGSEKFLREVLHVRRVLPRSTSTLRTLHLGEHLEFEALYAGLEIGAPAEAALLNTAHQTAALRLDSGAFRAVYLPFDLRHLGASVHRVLVESSVLFLQQEAIDEVVLDVPGHEILDQTLGMQTDSTATIEARIKGSVEAVELIVRSVPDMEVLRAMPMQEAGTRDGFQVFAAPFQPPDLGQYHLSLQLSTADEKTLFSSAGLRVLGIFADLPILLLLGDLYTPEEKGNLVDAFAEIGLQASVVELGDEDGAFYKALLSQYLDEGEVVVWLGDEMDEDTREAFRRFLERGGRLFIASLDLTTLPGAQTFLSDMLHIAGEPALRRSTLRSAGLLAGPDLEFAASHVPFKRISPPAVPVLLNSENQAAGLRLDTGTYRVVFLPFDLKGNPEELLLPLLRATLPFMYQPEFDAVLELPEHEIEDHAVLVSPERELQVRARVEGQIETAELIVRTQERLELVAEIPMELKSSAGGKREFEVAFQAPERERYQFFLQLRDAEDRPFLGASSLQVNALLFDQWQPILVFMDERFTAVQKEKFIGDMDQLARNLGLGANILESAPRDESLYNIFLEHYLEEGEMVLWLGNVLGEEAQDVFRDFMERGGQVLMASDSFQFSPNVLPFLQEMFHIVDIPKGLRTQASQVRSPDWPEPRNFILNYMRIEPMESAVPVLLAKEADIMGLRLDAGTYRAVYLSVDLRSMERRPRQELLEANLSFLHQRAVQGAQLEIKLVIDPAPAVGLAPVAPRVVVANSGKEAAAAFRVGYQILRGEEIVATGQVEEDSLKAQAQKEILLPQWDQVQEGDYRIRFGAGPSGAGDLVYSTDRRLFVVAAQTLFEEVELGGDLNWGNGAAFFDYDGDGDPDIHLVRWNQADRLLRNDGEHFSDQIEAAGLEDDEKGRGVAVGDYDGDGDLDLYLAKENANRFFRNEGEGKFAEITAALDADSLTQAPLGDEFSGRSAGFFDYDGDGDLDLYLVNAQVREEGGVNRLFDNEGGLFSERATLAGLEDNGNGRGLGFGDYDGDGQVDVFVANTAGQSRFFRNEAGTFRNVNDDLGMIYASGEIGPAFGDYDNDGDLDLFVANEEGLNQLFRNEGGTSFQQIAHQDTLYLGEQSVGTIFADYDLDGDLDLVTTTLSTRLGGDELYQNRDGFLVPVGGLVGMEPKSNGRGLSAADYDLDGDLDLLVADGARTRLYRNITPHQGHWLQVELEGTEHNRHALGARVELKSGAQRHVREIQLVYGYCSQASPRLHFGLGDVAQVDTLRVLWPGGQEGILLNLSADQLLSLGAGDLITAVLEERAVLPEVFALQPNYPNPFNAQTMLSYQLPQKTPVELTIYNVAGQRVKRLVRAVQEAGYYQVSWKGRDEKGRPVGSGVYLYRLRAGSFAQTRRLVVLK